jgi:hypothetical protein
VGDTEGRYGWGTTLILPPLGAIGEVPAFNVSAPVMGQDFWIFELSGVARSSTPVQ